MKKQRFNLSSEEPIIYLCTVIDNFSLYFTDMLKKGKLSKESLQLSFYITESEQKALKTTCMKTWSEPFHLLGWWEPKQLNHNQPDFLCIIDKS